MFKIESNSVIFLCVVDKYLHFQTLVLNFKIHIFIIYTCVYTDYDFVQCSDL